MFEAKFAKIRILKLIVLSRWFLHLGILLLGLIQKIIGVAQFNPKVFLLLGVSYSYNFIYYLYLKQNIKKISWRGLRIISLLQVIVDQLLYTFIVYSTGGVESLSFLFYFLTIFIAIILFKEIEIIALTLLSGLLYLAVIYLEYSSIIPHHWRYLHNPGFYQDIPITVHNSATVVLIIIFTAFFAAFIGRVIRSREEALQAETSKVNITLNNLLDGILVINNEEKIILVNHQAANIFHTSVEELHHKYFSILIFEEPFRSLISYILDNVKNKKHQSQEISIKGIDEEIVLKVECIPLHDKNGNFKDLLVVLKNITREKELDRLKSDFISIAAHQLRTPLATIKWLFKMLIDGDAGELDSKQKELLVKGLSRNNEVIEMVNNMLDVSEIEEGRMPLKKTKCSLDQILKQVYQNSLDNAQHKELKLSLNLPKEILPIQLLDLQKIRMAFQNLIDNAIKYTRSGGSITIDMERKNNIMVIKIIDTGIGIAKEDQKQLFSRFFRTRRAIVEEPTGSGLGLYIVKKVIEKHNGNIYFISQENKGTSFFVELPIS